MKTLLTDEIVFTPNGSSQPRSSLLHGFSHEPVRAIEVGAPET
jgi:hypothetical protein